MYLPSHGRTMLVEFISRYSHDYLVFLHSGKRGRRVCGLCTKIDNGLIKLSPNHDVYSNGGRLACLVASAATGLIAVSIDFLLLFAKLSRARTAITAQ